MSTLSHRTRRELLQITAVGALGASCSGWVQALAKETAKNPKRRKSVIMLWLNGGPATIDLWDLKPGHKNGGPFREIRTAVPDVRICEHLPKVAAGIRDVAIIRSMATREGDHGRARYVGHTGYVPQGAIQFPALGSLIAHELADLEADLPGFVAIGGGRRNGNAAGGGFLGPRYSPLLVGGDRDRRSREQGAATLDVPNLRKPDGVNKEEQKARLNLLAHLDRDFSPGEGHPVVETLRASTSQAIRLMRPEASRAFRLTEESEKIRDSYGRTTFGQGCLLARRLVERGVPFVEVTLDGWDSHRENFTTVERLGGILDQAFAALLSDLRQRGLLEDTLIVCQGEFGRTPRINGATGRDHWPASWAAVLAGGGIKGGQAVGKTTPDGMEVASKPVRTPDLIATVLKAIKLDPMKQNMSNVGRPIRLADPKAQPIQEVL